MQSVFRRSTAPVILLLFCIIFSIPAVAQSRLTVLNDALKPIAGANVQNLTNGSSTVTDAAGTVVFQLDANAQIKISYVGFVEQTVELPPNKELTVILQNQVTALDQVQVEGFLGESSLREQAGAISMLKASDFDRFNLVSLVHGVNTVPGIRFEERANGSYRVSIRGSSIRSPFGVRNVKVYWNGIPFTEPGGNTFLNLLDMANVGNVEIIKGPAGSIYGAGTGGVMKIQSTNLTGLANKIAIGTTVGSYGLTRYNASINSITDQKSLTFKFASQQSDGYRDHNALDRKVAELDLAFFLKEDRTITANLLYSDLFYEIPGGLNPDQLIANRRQARPGSEAQNASINNEMFLIKLGQESKISSKLDNSTHLYTSFNQFTNPFNLDFKRDNQQVFGVRTEFDLRLSGVDILFGNEHQNSFFDGKNFGNVGGEADTIRFADEVNTVLNNFFAQGNIDLGNDLQITAGFSVNSLKYDINRLIDAFTNNPQRVEKKFETVWSPRLAISKQINDNLSLHLSMSRGFSPPTTTEVRTNEGTLSLGLEPERGTNYEFNLRGSLIPGRLSFDLAAFQFRLDETIVSNPNQDGVVLFENAGETLQNGLEIQLQANVLAESSGFVKNLTSGISYTYHNFEFRDYIKRGNDFSGNALPGTAPHTLNLRADVELAGGLNLNLTYHYADPIPLNDANTFSSDAYHLVNARLSYEHKGRKTGLKVYVGVDNLTNAKYSLGNDLNAFGRRYFQPAPEANYYLGLNLSFDYK